MTINITQNIQGGIDPANVRENIIEWAGENDIEVEVLNELLDSLGLEQRAEWVEVEVTVTALVKVRVTSEMAASDVLDKATYEGLTYTLDVYSGYIDGIAEVEVEDITSTTVEGVEAADH